MKRCAQCNKSIPEYLDHCIYCGWDFDRTNEKEIINQKEAVDNQQKTKQARNKKKKTGHSRKKKTNSILNQPWFIILLLLTIFPIGVVLAVKNRRYYEAPKSTLYATTFGVLLWIQLFSHYAPTDDILLLLEIWMLFGIGLVLLWLLSSILQLSIRRSLGYASFTTFAICLNTVLLFDPRDIDYSKLLQINPFQIWNQSKNTNNKDSNSTLVSTEKPVKDTSSDQKSAGTSYILIDPNEIGPYGIVETVNGNDEIHYYLKEGSYNVSLNNQKGNPVTLILYDNNTVKQKLTIRSLPTRLTIEQDQYFTLNGTATIQFERNN